MAKRYRYSFAKLETIAPGGLVRVYGDCFCGIVPDFHSNRFPDEGRDSWNHWRSMSVCHADFHIWIYTGAEKLWR